MDVRSLRIALTATLVLAGVSVALWLGERGTDPAAITRYLADEEVAAAETATEALDIVINYSPDTVEGQAERVRVIGTGSFLEDYEELIEGGLSEVVAETAATSDGEIVTGPDISFVSATQAVAVARVAQEVTTLETPTPRNVFSVMRVGLSLVDGNWLAAELEILSQNSL